MPVHSIDKTAPVGISTYARPDHLRRTVEALLQNRLAAETDVFVFSDAPRPGDEEKVAQVREYLGTVSGFRSFHVIERSENGRVANNRGGMRMLLERYGRMIFLEEDIVTSRGFLTFMNEALERYGDHERVLGISGYALPLPWVAKSDIFTLGRFCAWGFAITREKFELIDPVTPEDLASVDRGRLERYGTDVYALVRRDAQGEIDALDVRGMYCCYKNDMVFIYPKRSLVQNIGHDGTGVHCAEAVQFAHRELWDKADDFRLCELPKPHPRNVRMNYVFRSDPFAKRVKRRFKRFRRRLRDILMKGCRGAS